MVYLVDVDNVILDFCAAYERTAESLGVELVQKGNHYNMAHRYAIESALSEKIYAHLDWGDMPAFPGAVDAVNFLSSVGDVYLVSSIDPAYGPAREHCLDAHGIIRKEFIPVGVNCSKERVIRSFSEVEAFVDDHASHIEEAHAAGVKNVFYVDHGYLYGRSYNIPDSVCRVPSLCAAVEMIKRKEGVSV